MLIRLDQVHKSYAAHPVLRGVSFQINPGERVGLVGRNGAGKTTIFRLATRTEEPDTGQVISLRGLRLGVLDQQPSFTGEKTVRDEAVGVFVQLITIENELSRLEHQMGETTGPDLDRVMHDYSDLRHRFEIEGGFTYHARAESVLGGLGFERQDWSRSTNELSGGQKARLALARLLLAEPDLLLLDEPTNHLDVDAVEWLEEFLNDYKSAFVIISHDRFLLDRTTTKIVEIEAGRANVYSGNYSSYVRQREERLLAQARQYEQQQEMIARTEEFIRRNLAGQKTKQAKSRRNMLERMDRIDAVTENRIGSFKLGNVARTGDNVLNVENLSVGYEMQPLASGISLAVRRGERLGIIGPNGSGKTTFLRTLTGRIEPIFGSFTWGANVKVDYFDQELANLDPGSSVLGEIASIAGQVSEGELRNYLARFLFSGDEVFKQVGVLSGGEKSRLALAKIIYGRSNVLVLDEPTNHLDIASREALEQALSEYGGTIITVSHDRYFLDRIATEILYFDDGTATYHAGTYSDFYEFRHHAQVAAQEPEPAPRAASRDSRPRQQPKAPKKARAAVEVEQEIHALEAELDQLAAQLGNPDPEWRSEHYAELNQKQQTISTELEKLYIEWESASSAIFGSQPLFERRHPRSLIGALEHNLLQSIISCRTGVSQVCDCTPTPRRCKAVAYTAPLSIEHRTPFDLFR
jgi:ATP-binding cassette subfamily F protein 3